MSTGNWRFYLTVVGYEKTQEGSMDIPVPGFSVLTVSTTVPGTWSHHDVALTFDGDIQRIYVGVWLREHLRQFCSILLGRVVLL
jgi:hypothetical protein